MTLGTLSDAHTQWQALYTHITHELSLDVHCRHDAEEFMREIKSAYDRLFETSPLCDRKFIIEIKKRVSKHADDEFQIPHYLNGFKHITAYHSDADFVDNSVELSINEDAKSRVQ